MLEKFYPDAQFDSVFDISISYLKSLGIKGIIFDIDNTLEPYENEKPSVETLNWLSLLDSSGIRVAFVSNNNKSRVEKFNGELRYPAYHTAMKPFKKNVLKAMADIGTNAENTMLVGDQMLTDVLAAHNAKIFAVLVKPIRDKTGLFTRSKRWIESLIIKRLIKKGIVK